ncbi:MAG: hypothetical protein JXA14_08905 [Anaerolineae bacterium]|nr:hypothetical protein [Anaerolineae bacterium]
MTTPRPIQPSDWQPEPIRPGQYFNEHPLCGFSRVDGLSGNPLHPALPGDDFEARLRRSFATLKRAYPDVHVARHTVQMPYYDGLELPSLDDYAFVDAPRALTTTSITVLLPRQLLPRQLLPQVPGKRATLGYYFDGETLLSLRTRIQQHPFSGVAGNMGYYMTRDLIENKVWAHNRRFPRFPLPPVRAYLGFHWQAENGSGCRGTFQGSRPAAVGVRHDDSIDILPRLDIDRYEVHLAGRTIDVSALDAPQAVDSDVVLFTPALHTPEIDTLIAETERSGGQSTAWQRFAPTIPLADAEHRVHLFVANQGNGQWPQDHVVAVWRGPAPLPSFGAVLSFKAGFYDALFGETDLIGQPVHVHPGGDTPLSQYRQMLGGLAPAVVDGQHIYCVESVAQLMRQVSRCGHANSPLALSGQESRNADPYIREPAGCLVQTAERIGWVFFDGRHELSIGVSIVDAALLLNKLERHGLIDGRPIQQAIFVDGGSAMKAYHVESSGDAVELRILNRVAAGSRNGPGNDPDGLNLYSMLSIAF